MKRLNQSYFNILHRNTHNLLIAGVFLSIKRFLLLFKSRASQRIKRSSSAELIISVIRFGTAFVFKSFTLVTTSHSGKEGSTTYWKTERTLLNRWSRIGTSSVPVFKYRREAATANRKAPKILMWNALKMRLDKPTPFHKPSDATSRCMSTPRKTNSSAIGAMTAMMKPFAARYQNPPGSGCSVSVISTVAGETDTSPSSISQ